MTFKILNRYRASGFRSLPGIILFVLMSALHAEVSINTIEKNDKVTDNEIPGQASDGTAVGNGPKEWRLSAEQWELARDGESILSLPAINALINAWLTDKQKKIEIQYPGGEEGEFWVQELTDWLVSLGIPSNHMVLVTGSGAGDMVNFNLIK